MSLRVVFDTSTLVSAALRVGSVPFQALQEALATCNLCACTETLNELEEVMDREKFDRYLGRPLRRDFVGLIRRNSHLFSIENVAPARIEPSCRDVKDDKFLALALAAEIDLLVASDTDLLILSPWNQIRIVKPGEFLARPASAPEVQEAD